MDTNSKKYLRLLRLAELITKYLPTGLSYMVMRFYTIIFSPDRGKIEADKISKIMGLPFWKARIIWYKYLQHQGIFFTNVFLHKKMDQDWLSKNVHIENPELLSIINDKGGLILTWHVQYHYTLFLILGLYGLKLNVLALAPEEGDFNSELKKYIDLLHTESEQKFSGQYLFYRLNNKFKRKLYDVLYKNNILLSLNDNFASSNRSVNVKFLNKNIDIMHGTVDVAMRLNKPIVTAFMYFSGNKFFVKLKQIDTNQNVQAIMQTYMTTLELELQKQPELWEGWHWL